MTDDAPQPPLPDLVRVEPSERNPVARIGLAVLALLLIVAGIILWILPVVPGFPLWIAGLFVLAMASRRAARWINRTEAKLPHRWRLLLRPKLRRGRKPGEGSR